VLQSEPYILGYPLSQLRDQVVNRPFKTQVFIGPFHWWGRNVYEFVVIEDLLIEFREEPYYYRSEVSNEWDFRHFMHLDVRHDWLWPEDYGIHIFKWIHMRAAHYVNQYGFTLAVNREFQMLNALKPEALEGCGFENLSHHLCQKF
jgi:hypothetical protein